MDFEITQELLNRCTKVEVKVKRLKQPEISYSYSKTIQPEVTDKMSMERKKIREMDLVREIDNHSIKESLRSILQGSGGSHRHHLFQEKKEGGTEPSTFQFVENGQHGLLGWWQSCRFDGP